MYARPSSGFSAPVALVPVVGVFAALTLLVIAIGPMATSDGPLHINFARFWSSGPAGPLQQQFYTVRQSLDPNQLVYIIAGPLIDVFGSVTTEAIVQLLCLFALPFAALTLPFPDRRSRNLAVILLGTLSLNQMFFMGLYNYALSLGAALIALSLTIRALQRADWWLWAGVALALLTAYFAHAAGLLAGLCFIAAWVAPAVIDDLRSGARLAVLARRWGPVALAVLPVVVLTLAFAAAQQSSPSIYVVNLQGRIGQLLRLDIIGIHGTLSRVAAAALSTTIIALATWAFVARIRAWSGDPRSRLDTVRYVLLIGGALALVLGFPEVAGGGWTHVRRMMPLPYIAAVLLITAGPLPRWRATAATAGAAVLFAVGLFTTMQQQSAIAASVAQSDRLLARVPNGCTILPIVLDPGRTSSNLGAIRYRPLIHVANRVESEGDRVVLYNYLARLRVYPVAPTPRHETKSLLFNWQPVERDPRIFEVDIPRFEAVSGKRVDYLFLQRRAPYQVTGLQAMLPQFETVASEPEFTLLRRTSASATQRSWCPRPESNRHSLATEGF